MRVRKVVSLNPCCLRLSGYRNEASMKKLLTNSIHQFLNLILVFSFSILICSNTFGQSNTSGEKLSANNLNLLSVKSGSSVAERPRVVVKNDADNKESKLLSQFEHQAF